MGNKNKNRVMGKMASILLALVLVLGLMPAQVASADDDIPGFVSARIFDIPDTIHVGNTYYVTFEVTLDSTYSSYNWRDWTGFEPFFSDNISSYHRYFMSNTEVGNKYHISHAITLPDTFADSSFFVGINYGGVERARKVINVQSHFGGTATCTSGPICERCGREYGSPDTENGHTFGDIVYDWADDMGSCTAWLTCTLCGYRFGEKANTTVSETKKPTCTADGELTYKVVFLGTEFPPTETTRQVSALGHDLKAIDKVEPTCTDPGTEAYWTCQRDGCGKLFSDAAGKNEIEEPVVIPALCHDWGEWKVTTEPAVGKAGEKQRTCNRCSEKETEAISALIGYTVTIGAGGSWTKGSSEGFTITVKRSEDDASCFSHYVETLIDGNKADVSAKSGSTIVTISAETLEKLGTGTHTITVKFDDGDPAEATFTIADKPAEKKEQPKDNSTPKDNSNPKSPKTGDNNLVSLWAAIMGAAFILIILVASVGRKHLKKQK
ncbi:MAG: hypothetical protein E7233_11125 [Lachnospiraceae bacterium]|nr:hypothetical protein [Lachnospiraceae bacterium]